MRYSQIRAFHYVATCGGFSRAAEALNVSQPAVSDQVRQLEAEHDVLLFNRNRKQITLTPTGERLLAYTRQFFDVEQQITEMLSESRAALSGTIRIIVDSPLHLADRMNLFRRRHPEMVVSLRTGNSTEILTALRNYDAEIGVVGSVDPGPDMTVRDLGASRIIAFAARDYFDTPPEALTLAEIAANPMIFRERGSKTRQKVEAAAQARKLRLRPAVEAEGREAMREIVAAGAGIGFVSDDEFGHDTRLCKIAISDCDLTMNETLVCLKQRSDVRAIRAFMNIEPGDAPD